MAKKQYDEPFELPVKGSKLLLHSCCAPCSGGIMEKLHENGIEYDVFFYNPNIHPLNEYEIRKQENIRYCDELGIKFIDADYDKDNWFARVKGMEWEPERGARCTACFDMRFERTALYAQENGYNIISSTLGISRWKNMEQINTSGITAAAKYDQVTYWTFNWRKQGGSSRMYELAKEQEFYKQEYCGCIYSLRDTNRWRVKRGDSKIDLGTEYYGFKATE